MKFEKDVFISYAHIDDESLIENQKGWIADLHRALEIRLAQLLGRRPVIWRDPSLQGNHIFDRQITDQFEKVAIMISVLSPRYVKSDWCLRELNEYYAVCQKNIGLTIRNNSRIFKVIKTPVRFDQQPEKIQNLLGYEFYTTDAQSGRIKEFAQITGAQTERLYWEKLNDLAHDIAAFIEELEQTHSPEQIIVPDLAPAENGTAKKIFLAESTFDTQEYRDSIKRELQDHGYKIYPDQQLPLLAPLLQQNVRNFLQETDLSIHLIGENYGIVPEGAQKSIVEIQNEISAAQSMEGKLPRLIWISETGEPVDERQISFIEKLNNGKEGITGADLVKGSLEEFKILVTDKLRSLEEKEKKTEVTTTGGHGAPHIIYLICDAQDLDDIKPLEDYFFDRGYEVVIPIFEGDEAQIREDHIENLKNCAGAVIYYGKASELWLRAKMRDFLKISGYGRSTPLTVKAVYVAGPPNPSKQRFRTLEAEVITAIDGLPEDKLKTLLSKLQ